MLRICEPPTGPDSDAAVTLRLIFGTPVGSSSSSLMARRPIRLLFESPCHPSRRITPPCGGSEPASDPPRGGHPGPGPGPSLHVNAFAARSRPRAGSAFAARPHFGAPPSGAGNRLRRPLEATRSVGTNLRYHNG